MSPEEYERVRLEREKYWRQWLLTSDESFDRFFDLLDVPEITLQHTNADGKPIAPFKPEKGCRYHLYDALIILRHIAVRVYNATGYADCSNAEKRWRELARTIMCELNIYGDKYATVYKYASKLAIVLWEVGATALYYQLCDCLQALENYKERKVSHAKRKPKESKSN